MEDLPPHAQPCWVLESREIFNLPVWALISVDTVALPSGQIVDDYWQIKLHVSVVYAQTQNGEILLLEEYRHGARRCGLEFPAGRLEEGEDPLMAAQRELLEETGYHSEQWESLGSYALSSTQGVGVGHVFRADGAVHVQEPCSGDLEIVQLQLVSKDRLRQTVRNGEFTTLYHLAVIGAALFH